MKKTSSQNKIFWIALLFSVFGESAFAADDCVEALRTKQNIIKKSTSKKSDQEIRDWFCSSDFKKTLDNQKSDVGIKIPIEDFPIEFKASSDNKSSMERRQQFCSDKNAKFSSTATESIYAQFLSDEVRIEALKTFGACKEASHNVSSLVKLKLEPAAERINISTRFDKSSLTLPPGAKIPEPRVVALFVSGLQCSSQFIVPNARITEQSITESCTRVQQQTATVTLVHDSGYPLTDKVPWDWDGYDAGNVTYEVQLHPPGWYTVKEIKHEYLPIESFVMFGGMVKFMVRRDFNPYYAPPNHQVLPLNAECIEHCEAIPNSEYGVFWRTLAPGPSVGIGVVQWRMYGDGLVPKWVFSTEIQAFSQTPVFAPAQRIAIRYNRALVCCCPRAA
jgi:hypothetical protein